jgi:hypothetical protein
MVLTNLSVIRGANAPLLTQWLMLALLCALIPMHIRSANHRSVPPRWITHATLLAGLGLCAAAVASYLCNRAETGECPGTGREDPQPTSLKRLDKRRMTRTRDYGALAHITSGLQQEPS